MQKAGDQCHCLVRHFGCHGSLIELAISGVVAAHEGDQMSLCLHVEGMRDQFPPSYLVVTQLNFDGRQVKRKARLVQFLANVTRGCDFGRVNVRYTGSGDNSFTRGLNFCAVSNRGCTVVMTGLVCRFFGKVGWLVLSFSRRGNVFRS